MFRDQPLLPVQLTLVYLYVPVVPAVPAHTNSSTRTYDTLQAHAPYPITHIALGLP